MTFRPSGFMEYSPSEQLIFDQLVEIITKNYEKFWYTHIHTIAVEPNNVLLAKSGEELGKQIFGLYGLAQGAEDLKDYSLHFDLTVPFARYVLDRESELTFPFKRYQIQPVRRGERPQKGRYREFFQCDLDVIRRKDSNQAYLYYDAEVIFTFSQTYQEILQAMNIDDTPVIHISNRKILAGFLSSLIPEKDVAAASVLIDKYQKIWQENFIASLKDLGISDQNAQKINDFALLKLEGPSLEKLTSLADTPLFLEGIAEMKEIIAYIETFKTSFQKPCPYVIDLQIVRWQDYYTGVVFETMLANDLAFGAVGGGGRYGELTGYIDPKRDTYAGVGASIGFSRLLYKIFEQQKNQQATVAEYLVLHFSETLEESLTLASQLQATGKCVEIYPVADKLGKQFSYADKKGIPYVIILGEGEKESWIYKIKHMQTGEEQSQKLKA